VSDTLVDKTVRFNSVVASLPIKGKVAYVFEWEGGEPVSYLISRPGGLRPEKVKVEDIVEVVLEQGGDEQQMTEKQFEWFQKAIESYDARKAETPCRGMWDTPEFRQRARAEYWRQAEEYARTLGREQETGGEHE
jgi:hypothetical protein